jgi:hypothetical protein
MVRNFFAVALNLCALVSLSAHAVTKCEAGLTSSQLMQLERAESSQEYEVAILHGERQGKPRTVVLLGESHIKGSLASRLGKETVQEFEFVGYEKVNIKRLIAGYALKAVLMATYKLHGYLTNQTYGSTIHDAIKMARQNALTGEWPRETFHVERDHSPGAAEQLGSVLLPPYFVLGSAAPPTCLLSACYWGLSWAFLPHASSPAGWAAVAAFGTSFALKQIVNLSGGVDNVISNLAGLEPRNATMVENSIAVFDERADVDKLLVIVGKSHVPGMVHLLEEQGFKQVSDD